MRYLMFTLLGTLAFVQNARGDAFLPEPVLVVGIDKGIQEASSKPVYILSVVTPAPCADPDDYRVTVDRKGGEQQIEIIRIKPTCFALRRGGAPALIRLFVRDLEEGAFSIRNPLYAVESERIKAALLGANLQSKKQLALTAFQSSDDVKKRIAEISNLQVSAVRGGPQAALTAILCGFTGCDEVYFVSQVFMDHAEGPSKNVKAHVHVPALGAPVVKLQP
jgi:hypothetical protein